MPGGMERRRVAPVIWAVDGLLLAIALVLGVIGLLRLDDSADVTRYVGIGGLVIAALSLTAAVSSAIAARASRASAQASAETAERARRALAFHNRPTGSLDIWTAFRQPPPSKNAGLTHPDFVQGVDTRAMGDTVRVIVTITNATDPPMTNLRFGYANTAGQSYTEPLTSGTLTEPLPGLTAAEWSDSHDRGWHVTMQGYWVECFDPETTTTWRASWELPRRRDASSDPMTEGWHTLTFEMV